MVGDLTATRPETIHDRTQLDDIEHTRQELWDTCRDGVAGDEEAWLVTPPSPPSTRKKHATATQRQRTRQQNEDFYVRAGEAVTAWWKTRRKTGRAFGRLVVTLLREALFASWTVQLQIVFLVTVFVLSLVFTIHIYHHSHLKPYPWRHHCATQPAFPIEQYRTTEPVGVLVGVMSTANDASKKRRMEIRNSWASHWASRGRWREGQIWGEGSDNVTLPDNVGRPTSRVIVRFIIGRPNPEYEASVREETREYNDIVVLPMKENMNGGKTFAFLDWASHHAFVPPRTLFNSSQTDDPSSSGPDTSGYSDEGSLTGVKLSHAENEWRLSNSPEELLVSSHDPLGPNDASYNSTNGWVRPDYIVKVDDDSFVMLAELEARLRVLPGKGVYWGYPVRASNVDFHAGEAYALSWDLVERVSTYAYQPRSQGVLPLPSPDGVPKSQTEKPPFMAEPAASSYWRNRIVSGTDGRDGVQNGQAEDRDRNAELNLPVAGREDQVTAGWMKDHGKEWNVTWYDERCWIYDHPKGGTVYSKGFLFPWEVRRIREEWGQDTRARLLEDTPREWLTHRFRPEYKRLHDPTYSTVLPVFYRFSYSLSPRWNTLYESPLTTLWNRGKARSLHLPEEITTEALIEGSELSMFTPDLQNYTDITQKWEADLERGWSGRYLLDPFGEGRDLRVPIGGTVVVHYVKHPEHWQDCIDVLLEGWAREQAFKSGLSFRL